jgi:hypothetical protein
MGIFKKHFSREKADETGDKEERKLMKDLSLAVVGEFARVMLDEGYNKQGVALECIILGMFLVTETYILSNRDSAKSHLQLDEFHTDMMNYLFNEYKKDTGGKCDIISFRNEFYEIIRSRYQEYREAFNADTNKTVTILSKTLGAFLDHFLAEPISEFKKHHSIVPLALKLLDIYNGMYKLFRNRSFKRG